MERRPEIGFASYDRFFPNQDTLPKGGFGNLIALPLQKNAREQGNSVFVDETLTPWPDPWVFLSSQPRVPTARLESIVQEATAQGRITGVRSAHPDDEAAPEPWKPTPSRRRAPALTGPMPRVIPLVLGDALYLPKTNLPPSLRNALLRLAAFQNPEFYKAQAMRRPTFDKRRIISCAEDHAAHLALPRGCLEETLEFLKTAGIKTILEDVRCQGKPLAVTFQGLLRDDQQAAAAAMRPHDTGVLAATTAFGKTVLAAWLIAQRGVNTLVLVHRQQLLDQWLERLSQFPGLNPKDVGRLGGGKKKLTGALDVALIQSLVRDGIDPPLAQLFVHATRPPAPDAEGFARARSASETFLHRRLETHPRLAGHFQLNAGLPLPFNDHSEMEVDFLCAPARLVIELDGPQHLTDPAAYRRDRRKDALLQMNGYFVLRFLTDELSKDLDHVIDQILRVLATRKR